MFGKKQQAQPKSEFEQPLVIIEEVFKEEPSQSDLPISPYTGEPYDPAWGTRVRGPKANPSIISKVWK